MKLLNVQLREKMNESEGLLFKIKRFSVHDGPGIRTSVFLKGCPLNCIWCHSPEGISRDISIWYDKSLCIRCESCVRACPESALSLVSDPESVIRIDRTKCVLNGDCVNVCPTNAMQFTGYTKSSSEVFSEILKDVKYYEYSGGGVTFTGGEPLNQPSFLIDMLEKCRENKIHTAIETSLYCEKDVLRSVIQLTDLFFADIKIFDSDSHARFTGRPNETIKDNFKFLAESGKKVIVRIPMVENITDTAENIDLITKFVHDTRPEIIIEKIDYNPLTENNYKRLGIPFLCSRRLTGSVSL